LDGEFHDKTNEVKIRELTEKVENLERENNDLKLDNVKLAEQLKDQRDLVTSYESQFYKKKD
jgi:regulator of replication initiation timing